MKEDSYYLNARADCISFLSDMNIQSGRAVLELGGGGGEFARRFCKKYHPAQYHLVDPAAEECLIQADSLNIEMHASSAEKYLVDQFEEYDYVVANDVIEHIDDFKSLLSLIIQSLVPGGSLVASLPNISNLRVLFNLFKGDFFYADAGVMDETHLRFFTPKSIKHYLLESGFKDVTCSPQGPHRQNSSALRNTVSRYLSRKNFYLLEHQFFVVAKKAKISLTLSLPTKL